MRVRLELALFPLCVFPSPYPGDFAPNEENAEVSEACAITEV